MKSVSPSDRTSAFHRRAVSRAEAAIVDRDPALAARRGVSEPEPDFRSASMGAGVLAIVLVGTALGLAATAVVLDRGWDPGAVRVGPWVASPRVGSTAIDPYAHAELARSGAVSMAASEGLILTATVDDTGYRLLRTCEYRLGGATPTARIWTLTATGRDGRTLDNPAHRSAFTSATLIRDMTGVPSLEIGPDARPGNWLPTSGAGELTLTLRLYDTPLAIASRELAAAAMPTITRRSCRETRSEAGSAR